MRGLLCIMDSCAASAESATVPCLQEERRHHELDEVDLGGAQRGGAAVHEGGHWETLSPLHVSLLEELLQHPPRPPVQTCGASELGCSKAAGDGRGGHPALLCAPLSARFGHMCQTCSHCHAQMCSRGEWTRHLLQRRLSALMGQSAGSRWQKRIWLRRALLQNGRRPQEEPQKLPFRSSSWHGGGFVFFLPISQPSLVDIRGRLQGCASVASALFGYC